MLWALDLTLGLDYKPQHQVIKTLRLLILFLSETAKLMHFTLFPSMLGLASGHYFFLGNTQIDMFYFVSLYIGPCNRLCFLPEILKLMHFTLIPSIWALASGYYFIFWRCSN